MKKNRLEIALADIVVFLFLIAVMLLGYFTELFNLNFGAVFSVIFVITYLSGWKLIEKYVVNESLNKEEFDKELSLAIALGVSYLTINQFIVQTSDLSGFYSFDNYIYMMFVLAIELLVYSSLAYFFKLRPIEKDMSPHEESYGEGSGYNEGYFCLPETLKQKLEKQEEQRQENNKLSCNKTIELIKPVIFLMNTIKLLLSTTAIYSFLIIFEIQGSERIGAVFASAGGSMAIFAFAFRDGLKSITSGVRIWMDDLVEQGDLIKSKSLGVHGIVAEISMTNIKVENLDNTITNISLSKLISSTFYNLSERKNKGRFVELTININIDSIKEFNVQDNEFKNKEFEKYLACKKESVYGERRQTNIGLYRAYLGAYLYTHELLNSEKIILVRVANENSIYGFVAIKILACTLARYSHPEYFKRIESDIMDHALIVLKDFDLKATRKFKL